MTAFYISAAHKSSGKTSVSIGLAGAMRKRAMSVQTFKRGPDYIDPVWLSTASENPCYNLDFNTQSHTEISDLYARKSSPATASFIEGSKGLFDGVAADGHDSNAALAKLLNLPVVLVIDCNGMTRGIAPLLLGYQAFDQDLPIAGVILNKVGNSRHESKLRKAVEHYTNIPVLGALTRSPAMEIPERHLGLMPANEMGAAAQVIKNLTESVEAGVDMDAILSFSSRSSTPTVPQKTQTPAADVTVAVARDAAFGFYYPDDLEAFASAGANLVFFDTLMDKELPACDGLFLGGGFPETHLKALQNNQTMRQSIKQAIGAGLPCYAECGGLMYLAQSITYKGQSGDMVGALAQNITVSDRPQGRGLVKLAGTGAGPWHGFAPKGTTIAAHEFHYAQLEDSPTAVRYAYDIVRGYGINGVHDGLMTGNCLVSFSHLRNTEQSPWVSAFVNFIRKCKG